MSIKASIQRLQTYLTTIDSCLVHSLNYGGPGTEYDEEVQHERLRPPMCLFIPKDILLFPTQLTNILKPIVALPHSRNKRPLPKGVLMLAQPPLQTPRIHIGDDLRLAPPRQRVAQLCSDRGLAATLALVSRMGSICGVRGGVEV